MRRHPLSQKSGFRGPDRHICVLFAIVTIKPCRPVSRHSLLCNVLSSLDVIILIRTIVRLEWALKAYRPHSLGFIYVSSLPFQRL